MPMHEFSLRPEDVRATLENHVPVIQHVAPVRKSESSVHVLLDDEDCAPLLGNMTADADQILHDQWREPLEGFVEQDEPRFAHEGARDRQHLLLATGKIASTIVTPLCQTR